MNLAETIYRHSLNLPETAAREALDFIEFLEQRYSATLPQKINTEAFLAALAGGLSEDFPDDIGDTDLGKSVSQKSGHVYTR